MDAKSVSCSTHNYLAAIMALRDWITHSKGVATATVATIATDSQQTARMSQKSQLSQSLRPCENVQVSQKSQLSVSQHPPVTKPRRRVIFCRDCRHYLPSPALHRPHGEPLPMPGGCTQDRTSPDSWPPIYPFTGHLCAAWTDAQTQSNQTLQISN